MARIKLGAIVVAMSGKLGGHVFSKNKGGAYMRTKVTPTNPRTSFQQAVRALLGSLSQQWSGLTAAARASFNNAVSDFQTTNIFGDTVKPSGKNLFVKLNQNAIGAGFPAVNTAPNKIEMPILAFTTATISNTLDTIEIDTEPIPVGFALVIRATPVLTAGTTNAANRFRQIFAGVVTPETPLALYTAYVARFGAIPAVGNIQFECKLVALNGQTSVPEIQTAVIAPVV